MGPGFSPLDEALDLGTGAYSPQVLTWIVRLGAELPFARAAFWLEELSGVVVSAASVRRQTEAVGATAVAVADAEVDRLEREADLPTPAEAAAPSAERRVVGADGAMVPLVGGEWAEVKLASIGTPEQQGADLRTTQVSYCARLADAATFARAALGELHRRGVFHAGAVAAVQDGAVWLQGFVDYHRPDATRILDWAHAVAHLRAVVALLFGEGTARSARVVRRLRGWLWEDGPDRVLAVLCAWVRARPGDQALATAVAYFTERRAQLAYPAFRAAGWPVGSGATESGHKQVMQARMKRAGMRWAREHVNPLLALRVLDCNGRWDTACPALLRQHAQRMRAARRHHHLPSGPPPQPVPAAHPAAAPPRDPTAPARLPPPPSPFRHPWRAYGTRLSAKL